MLLFQHGLSHAWKNGFQRCVTLSVDLQPPSTCLFCQYCWPSIATSTSFDCAAFSMVPMYEFLNNAGSVPLRWHIHRAVSGLGYMLAFHCICMVLYSEKNFSPVFGPSSGSTYACISLYLHGVVLRKDFLACVWAKFLSRKIVCKKDLR
jgi:hypothetical protein